jgi:hypothetical protein
MLSCVARDEYKPGKYNGVAHKNDVILAKTLILVGQEAVHGQDLLAEVANHLCQNNTVTTSRYSPEFTVNIGSILECLYRMDVGNVTDVSEVLRAYIIKFGVRRDRFVPCTVSPCPLFLLVRTGHQPLFLRTNIMFLDIIK